MEPVLPNMATRITLEDCLFNSTQIGNFIHKQGLRHIPLGCNVEESLANTENLRICEVIDVQPQVS